MRAALFTLAALPLCSLPATAQEATRLDTRRGDAMIAEYFRQETRELADRCLAEIRTADDWNTHKVEYRRQLFEMLGLDPLPERTDLRATVTGTLEHDDFIVEKLHFQSRPGLYVTGNLYRPREVKQPLPAVLYVCGHGRAKKDGVSFGNKTTYQHHPAWFARNGYVALAIDTLQLGEIEGTHHGTYGLRERGGWKQLWWWNARGYTPAGVEAWNCIRALDYLQSRPEVDGKRLGVTGRSGGGAYSWWISALDERIGCAVPVAGITDLENHVVDGAVEGHCDCMFMVNTYRWDYPQVAALVAPRPLLISNSDKDGIFPLEGVVRTHAQARRIYRLLDAGKNFGLQITEGGHRDTQELRVHAFHWFNHFLRNTDTAVLPAEKYFEQADLAVFPPGELPPDQINTRVHDVFVPRAEASVPESGEDWQRMRDQWRDKLRQKSFRGWPAEPGSLGLTEAFRVTRDGIDLAAYDFTSEGPIKLRLYLAHRAGLASKDLDLVVLNVLDAQGWSEWLAMIRGGFAEELKAEQPGEPDTEEFAQTRKMFAAQKWAMAWLAPRGVGPTAWNQSERKQTHHRRRFMLLGQTLDGMQAWDVRRGIQALRQTDGMRDVALWLQSERNLAGVTLYASLFEPAIARLDLWNLAASHQPDGPDFLNVLRFLDIPQAVAMAAERSKVRIYERAKPADGKWRYPAEVAKKLGWDQRQLQVRVLPAK